MVHLVTSRFRLGDVCPMAPAHGERREASKVATSAELLGSEGFPSGWVGAVCGGFFVRLAVDKGNDDDDDDDDFWLSWNQALVVFHCISVTRSLCFWYQTLKTRLVKELF